MANSDYFLGHLNGKSTIFRQFGVYQYTNNLTLDKEIEVPAGMSDHHILIFTTTAPYELNEKEAIFTSIDKGILENNQNEIANNYYAPMCR